MNYTSTENMIGHIFWAVFLAVMLGFSFHQSWKFEHGKKAPGERGKETSVWFPPTTMFWILLAFLVLILVFRGIQKGLTFFTALSCEVMVLISIYFILMLIVLPLLRRWFSARACAVLWLVPTFLFWQVHILMKVRPLPRYTLYLPHKLLPIIVIVWLVGFIAVGGYYIVKHIAFSKFVRSNSEEECDKEILAIWNQIKSALDYQRPVKLLRADVSTPFSMGRINRTRSTVLPRRNYTTEELSMIFSHELHHLQRSDVDTKIFLSLCNAFCWFNPLVWLATKKAAEDLERSCDEIVTENMSESERKNYANLLLDSAGPIGGFTTCLSAAAATLRYRLKSVMNQKNRFIGTVLIMVALFTCVMCSGVFSITDSRGSFTSLVMSEDEIIAIYDGKTPIGSKEIEWDDNSLNHVLEGIELERIAGAGSFSYRLEDEYISFILSDNRIANLYNQTVIVNDFEGGSDDFYIIKGDFDIESLRACFR